MACFSYHSPPKPGGRASSNEATLADSNPRKRPAKFAAESIKVDMTKGSVAELVTTSQVPELPSTKLAVIVGSGILYNAIAISPSSVRLSLMEASTIPGERGSAIRWPIKTCLVSTLLREECLRTARFFNTKYGL